MDEENINKYAQDNKIQYSTYADLAENEDIQKLIDKEIKDVNHQLAKVQMSENILFWLKGSIKKMVK